LPLLEEQGARNLAARAARDLGRRLPTVEEALVQALASRDNLTMGLAAATVDAGLLARAVPDLDVEAAERILSTGGAAPGSPAVAAGGSPASLPSPENSMLSPVEKMLHLRNLDLFEELTTPQLSELSRVVTEVRVGNGEAIVSEGEYDDSMYFIVVGKVLIVRGGQSVAELGVGDFFGEMSVFDGEKRSATAVALGEVRLLRLARNDLFDVMEDQPAIGIGICQILVRRVRNLLDERSASLPIRS
ncbi:MAG: cyclic nucleotide-binding domain-containing protein, partial [Candidatus Binatia bacterium]